MDFGAAAEVLGDLAQVAISPSSVWQLAERWGERCRVVEAQQRAEAAALPPRSEIVAGEAGEERRMGAALDGGMIPVREEGWKELKVGSVFEMEPRQEVDPQSGEEGERAHAVDMTYVAHLGGPERFGQALWTEARQRGWTRARDSQVLGDGAAWIWNLCQEHFYDSVQTVDYYHATRHLAQAAEWLYGEGAPKAKHWYKTRETQLYAGQALTIAQELRRAALKKAPVADDLRREAGYFRTNQGRMQYLELREEGYLIGSGVVESACKQYRQRFAGPGMRWSRAGAERLLPIRSAIMSRRFDALWKSAYRPPRN